MSYFFRVYYTVQGGHTHTRWFAGKGARETAAMGCCGDLTFRNEEFNELKELIKQAQIAFYEEAEGEKK